MRVSAWVLFLTFPPFFGVALSQNCGPFLDVPGDAWYCNDLKYLLEEGIITSRSEFRPSDQISRAEFLKMVIESTRDVVLCDPGINPFEDVLRDAWYAKYVAYAKSEGIVEGQQTPQGLLFLPNSPINKVEAIKMMLVAADLDRQGILEDLPEFTDESSIPSWATSIVDIAQNLRIVEGKKESNCNNEPTYSGEAYLCPTDAISRAEATTMIARLSRGWGTTTIGEIIKDQVEEAFSPVILSECVPVVSLDPGEAKHFKFEVEPGYHYSLILNSGIDDPHAHTIHSKGALAPSIQARMIGATRSQFGVENNPSAAISAIMFYADPKTSTEKFFNYITVDSNTNVINGSIRLVKTIEKLFGHPFTSDSDHIILYHNQFGHKDDFDNNGTATRAGHDGIDVVPLRYSTGNLDEDRSIVPIADGIVIRVVVDLGNNLGAGIWVYHESVNMSSAYIHLGNVNVSVGNQVSKGKTDLGRIDSGHLHLEIYNGWDNWWSDGYSNGGGGQVNPLPILFEQ